MRGFGESDELGFTCGCSVLPSEELSSDQENVRFVFPAPGLALGRTCFVLTASNLKFQVEKKQTNIQNNIECFIGALWVSAAEETQRCGSVFSMRVSEVRQDTTNKVKPTDLVTCSRCLPCRGAGKFFRGGFHGKCKWMAEGILQMLFEIIAHLQKDATI